MSSNVNGHRESRDFNIDRNNSLYKWSRRLTSFLLTFGAIDPFAVNRIEEQESSRRGGWTCDQWMRLTMPLTAYLSIKPLIVVLIRSMKLRLDDELADKLGWLLALIGDPFSSPPFPRLIVFFFLPIASLWIRFHIPLNVRYSRPYDSTLVRFILEPEEEIRQFDLQASKMVEDAVETIESQQRRLSCGNCSAGHRNSELSGWFRVGIQQQLMQMKQVGRQIQTIRPTTLSPIWHHISYRASFLLLASALVLNIVSVVVGTNYFVWVGWHGRCCELRVLKPEKYEYSRETGWPKCRLLDAFSPSDILMILESNLLNSLIMMPVAAAFVALTTLQICNQLHLSADISRRLHKQLAELRTYDPLGDIGCAKRASDGRLTRKMFKNLVRIWMFDRESQKCVATLAHGTELAIFGCLLFTSTAFASIRMQSSLDKQIASGQVDAVTAASAAIYRKPMMILVLLIWSCVTVELEGIMFACSMIPAQFSRIERTVYSIMAELVNVQRSFTHLQGHPKHNHLFSTDNAILLLWRRITLKRSYSNDQPAVCAFTLKLTFERVLAIQYFALTVISLLYSYIQ